MNYKLAAFDMDGTLLNSRKQISRKNLEMINKASAAGKIICLSTGRSLPELTGFSELKSVQYFICISGALIYDNLQKKILYSKAISDKNARQLFELVKNRDVMIHFHSDKSVVQKDKVCNMKHYMMAEYQDMFKKITFQPENILEYYDKTKIPLYKINLYSTTPAEREKLFNVIKNLDLTMVYSEVTSIECSAKGVSKASGLLKLCSMLNIPVENTIAVGDSYNDIEILKAAGLSVAMGNSKDAVKQIADVVVNDNDNDGCAQVIEKYLLD